MKDKGDAKAFGLRVAAAHKNINGSLAINRLLGLTNDPLHKIPHSSDFARANQSQGKESDSWLPSDRNVANLIQKKTMELKS